MINGELCSYQLKKLGSFQRPKVSITKISSSCTFKLTFKDKMRTEALFQLLCHLQSTNHAQMKMFIIILQHYQLLRFLLLCWLYKCSLPTKFNFTAKSETMMYRCFSYISDYTRWVKYQAWKPYLTVWQGNCHTKLDF